MPYRQKRKRDGKPEGREGRAQHRILLILMEQVYEQLAEGVRHYKQISVSDGSASVAAPFQTERGTERYKFNPRYHSITETTLYRTCIIRKIREKTDYGTDGNRTDSSILCICIPGLSARDTNDGAGSS